MKYLHTMVRVSDVEQSLRFYCDALGLKELRRQDSEKGRFTLMTAVGILDIWPMPSMTSMRPAAA